MPAAKVMTALKPTALIVNNTVRAKFGNVVYENKNGSKNKELCHMFQSPSH
jgi:hypothetical protein